MSLWAQASIRSRLLGWRCEAVAAASSRQIRSRARSRWTAGSGPYRGHRRHHRRCSLQRVALVIERRTGVRHHPSHVWRIPSGDGLDPPAAPAPGQRTRRGGDRPLGQDRLAPDPPTTRAGAAPGSCSGMRAGSASPRRCGVPGHPAAARRSCGTASATGRGCRWPRCAAIGPTGPAPGWRSTSSRAATTTSC
jgi:hypothetical protein